MSFNLPAFYRVQKLIPCISYKAASSQSEYAYRPNEIDCGKNSTRHLSPRTSIAPNTIFHYIVDNSIIVSAKSPLKNRELRLVRLEFLFQLEKKIHVDIALH